MKRVTTSEFVREPRRWKRWISARSEPLLLTSGKAQHPELVLLPFDAWLRLGLKARAGLGQPPKEAAADIERERREAEVGARFGNLKPSKPSTQ